MTIPASMLPVAPRPATSDSQTSNRQPFVLLPAAGNSSGWASAGADPVPAGEVQANFQTLLQQGISSTSPVLRGLQPDSGHLADGSLQQRWDNVLRPHSYAEGLQDLDAGTELDALPWSLELPMADDTASVPRAASLLPGPDGLAATQTLTGTILPPEGGQLPSSMAQAEAVEGGAGDPASPSRGELADPLFPAELAPAATAAATGEALPGDSAALPELVRQPGSSEARLAEHPDSAAPASDPQAAAAAAPAQQPGQASQDDRPPVAAQVINAQAAAQPADSNLAAFAAREGAHSAQAATAQAERVQAWRGLSTSDSTSGAVSLDSELPAAINSSAMRMNLAPPGQLQQFVEKLNAAVAAEAAAVASSSSGAGEAAADELPAVWMRSDAAAQASSAAAQARGQAMAPGFPTASTLNHSFEQPQWGESFARHIALLTGQKVSAAQVQLDPPELGSLMVRISLTGDQASISFMSPHASVRDSIEQSFDRLQSLLAEQGLDLVEAEVSDQPAGREGGQQANTGGEGRSHQEAADALEADAQLPQKVGLVDYYA